MLNEFFKSIIDQDTAPIVICNLNNERIYMNPSAVKRYKRRGGEKLLGKSLLECHNDKSNELIKRTVEWFSRDKNNNRIFAYYNKKENRDVYIVALRDSNGNLIGYYEKHEYRNRETSPCYNF